MYTYENFKFRPFTLFMVIVGIILFFSKMYTEGIIIGLIGIILSISFKGLNIDPEKMVYRQYDRFLWFYVGNWEPIGRPLYVTVVRIKLSGRRIYPIPMATAEEGESVRTYKINLVVEGRKRYISLFRGNRMKMLMEAYKIAQLLNIHMLDHTTSEKRWVK